MEDRIENDLKAFCISRMTSTSVVEINGVWQVNYSFRTISNGVPYNLKFIVIGTNAQGCCYLEPYQQFCSPPNEIIGKSIFEIASYPLEIKIAALDSFMGSSFNPKLARSYQLKGNIREKSIQRSDLISLRAKELIRFNEEKKIKIVLVGYIEEITHSLFKNFNRKNVDIVVYDDRDDFSTINMPYSRKGEKSTIVKEVKNCDVLISTGMAITKKNFFDLIQIAKENNTKIIMYCQTAANCAEYFLDIGIDAVVSEKYPFYLIGNGVSEVLLY